MSEAVEALARELVAALGRCEALMADLLAAMRADESTRRRLEELERRLSALG